MERRVTSTEDQTESTGAPTSALARLWSAYAASVSVVLVSTITTYVAASGSRFSFSPSLRYAIAFPLTVTATVCLVWLYQSLGARRKHPRTSMFVFALGFAVLFWLAVAIVGPPGLHTAVALPAFAGGVTAALFIPYFTAKPPRWSLGTVLILLLGSLEVLCFVGAITTEPIFSPGLDQTTFDVPRTAFDADQRFVDLSHEVRIHYMDEGSGPTLLFLHGNPSWSFQWHELFRNLRSSNRCVALDYPGFGMSSGSTGFGYTPEEQSRVVEEFVDKLQLKDITLVMQDWGGPIGIALAERRPELIHGVILGSTWAWKTEPGSPRGKFSRIFGGPLGKFIQVNFPRMVSVGLRKDVKRHLSPEVVALYQRPFLPPDRRLISSYYPKQITSESDFFAKLEAGLPTIHEKPALILLSWRDPGFSRDELKRWETVFPHHRTVSLPNGGHFFFEDEPSEVVAAIHKFMAAGPDLFQ